MTYHSLLLAFPHLNSAHIKQRFTDSSPVPWVYLGYDSYRRRGLERALGSNFVRINTVRLVDEVAQSIKNEYVAWTDEINRQTGKNLEWWIESPASRNTYLNNSFLYCCYLVLLQKLWSNELSRPRLVVVESGALARSIVVWATKNNIPLEVIGHAPVQQARPLRYSIPLLRCVPFLAILLARWLVATLTRVLYGSKNLHLKPSVILDTFVHPTSLQSDGAFQDRYFPHLHQYIAEQGLHVLVHPVLHGFRLNNLSIYKRMRRSRTLFIIQEDFLRVCDYVSVLSYPLKALSTSVAVPSFRDFDISSIIHYEYKSQPLASRIQALLIYRLFLRLGEAGLDPSLVINWYENQPIDKALIAGVRKAFPRARIIGAQLFIHLPSWLSLYPTQSEFEACIAPDVLLATSQHQCTVAQTFTRSIPCRPVAPLRYTHVFEDEIGDDHPYLDPPVVMVLLPFDISEAIELLKVLTEATAQIRRAIHVEIKGHPDCDIERVTRSVRNTKGLQKLPIFTGTLPEALQKASVVVSTGSSSLVEAAVKGIPVIFVGKDMVLNQNLMAGVDMDIVTEAYSTEELRLAVEKYINLSLADKMKYREMGRRLRGLFFGPMNQDTLKPFLELEEDGSQPAGCTELK